MEFKIYSGFAADGAVPRDPGRRGRPSRYPFRELAIGESFVVHESDGKRLWRACRNANTRMGITVHGFYENPNWRIVRVK